MFNRRPFSHSRPEGPYRRGVFRYIILEYLRDRPSHGYEIIRALEERFSGLYVPSAGTIYPRLQRLEEQGYVTSVEQEGKRVYTITDEGRRFLAEHSELEQEIKEHLDDWRKTGNIDDIRKTMHEFGRIAGRLWEARQADPEKLKRVQDVLSRTYEEIENILKD